MRLVLKIIIAAVLLIAVLVVLAIWQPVLASKLVWSVIEDRMLADPFVGLTHDGELEPGLFNIKPTGVSTQQVVDAANQLIASLDAGQRSRTLFPVDDLEWRRWANIHISTRQGVGLLEMNEAQIKLAMDLLGASLSARGLQTATDIMKLEGHLADLKNDHDQYGEKRYWFTIMGQPDVDEPWGWQIDGHHLIINYFVLGDQVVMTPTFMGSEPVKADSGRFGKISILEQELSAGLALVNSLDDTQRTVAIISDDKPGNNNRGELFKDNAVVPYIGLALSELSAKQNNLALQLVNLYIGNLPDGHARIKLEEILKHWHETRFSWVGGTGPDSVFYYRIHSPVVLIEYDHQKPVALEGPNRPSRVHVHTVVRTPNGNDYGKDLLQQHLRRHAH